MTGQSRAWKCIGWRWHWPRRTVARLLLCCRVVRVMQCTHSSALPPMQQLHRTCTALQGTHMQVTRRERSIAADEWMDGAGRAWELHVSPPTRVGCAENFLRSSLSGVYTCIR